MDKKPDEDCSCQKPFVCEKKLEDWFSVSVSDKSLTLTYLAFANEAAWGNLDTFHEQRNSFSSPKRYFQGNCEAPRTEIIQK